MIDSRRQMLIITFALNMNVMSSARQ